MLTDAEKRRYNRHIMLPEVGEEGQVKLKDSSVLVVGAGGLGAPVLQYLTAAGIGKIGILDYDTVNEDNLHRQVLYGGQDLGKLKTIIASQRLTVLNPLTEHVMINIKLNQENAAEVISDYTVIVDATDNFQTRYLINDVCLKVGKPWVYGSIYKYEGQVSVFNYQGGPTLRDLYDQLKDKENVPDPSKAGLFGILPGIIGSLQAAEVIKIITEIGIILSGKLIIYNMLDNTMNTVSFSK
jgi:sulfur-carrier protein adenylyltransferase/sulfurtransferase